MPRIIVASRDGKVLEIEAAASRTLMEVIREEGLEIEALCGGCCSCATCHVYIDPEFLDLLPPMSEDEDILLEGSGHRHPGTSRLSCQIRLTEQMEGLRLTVAPPD
jgi:2Fe-2S ferredoxin